MSLFVWAADAYLSTSMLLPSGQEDTARTIASALHCLPLADCTVTSVPVHIY